MIWAQGYSEPGAGSDLASLSTRATLEGDHFVVRGQKIWTTWAHHADWMFALVRTDPQAQPRQAGISFLLIDLHSPGIRIRPIKTIAGDDEFAEVFFDDVIVPAENLVGKLHDGWRIANALLGHERLGTSNPQFALDGARSHQDDGARVRDHGGSGVPGSSRGGQHQCHGAVGAVQPCRGARPISEQSLGPEASIIKIFGSELLQELNELLIEAAGGHASADDPIVTNFGEVEVAMPFLSVAARDDLWRFIGNPAQRRGAPRPQSSELRGAGDMELHLTSEQTLLRDSAAKFVGAAGPKVARGFREQDPSFAPARLRRPASSDGLAFSCRRSAGGLGLGLTELALVLEQAGRGLVCEPIGLAAISAAALARGARRIRCWSG